MYHRWMNLIGINPNDISEVHQIPFLPISMFKTQKVSCLETDSYEACFLSSSTTGQGRSQHYVPYTNWYESLFLRGFELFYGPVADLRILALLPSYIENGNSSLIYMVNHLVAQGMPGSGFFHHNRDQLIQKLNHPDQSTTLLLGVTYALLDLAEFIEEAQFTNTIIMETGGMKGKREEMTRDEVHTILKKAFNAIEIHSEYGMTELMSQAYSKGNGNYAFPPWAKVVVQDQADFTTVLPSNKTGRICIMDLGNLYSCSFVATDDLGKLKSDNLFEIQGRLDFADIRGCNLMWD